MVVPQADIPKARLPGVTVEALHAPLVGASEASSFTTTPVGTAGVKVLLIKSLRAESETNPSGVIGQVQQETNCSSGENVYTFAQMLPFWVGNAAVEEVPALVTLTTESPTLKLEE